MSNAQGQTNSKTAAARTRLAIVVGTHNRLGQLRDLVESIRQNVRTDWALKVSDAGSTDGTAEWLRDEAARDGRIACVFDEDRRGQAAALNAIFRTLDSDFVCWLSDDNVLVGDGLDRAVEALAADDRLGMVGLKVRDMRGPFADEPYIGGITSVGVLNMNQGVLPTSLLKALGGFDETFRDYGIDADLTTRVLLTGRTVALTRSVAVDHYRNWGEKASSSLAAIEARNAAYRSRYRQTYAPLFGTSVAWILGRAVWRIAMLCIPEPAPEAARRAAFYRDCRNVLAGRFISLGREIADRRQPIHLRQKIPVRMARRIEKRREGGSS